MNDDPSEPDLDLEPLIALINAEVRAAVDEIEQRYPANLRLTSVRVAMGQRDTANAPTGDEPVLRRDRYSLSQMGWMIEMAFGGGSGRVRQRGGDWTPLPRAPSNTDRARPEADERRDRKGATSTGRRAVWIRVLQILLIPFDLARRFFRWAVKSVHF